jgi:excisionase family DNA binding protein
MRRVLAKEIQEIVADELEIYSGLDDQFEATLALLDASSLIGRDELRQAFEVVGSEEEGERAISAAEFVLILAGYLDETAAIEHLGKETRLQAHHIAGIWRDQVEGDESAESPPAEMLSVAAVAAHFGVTPQAVYKWCEAGKIDYERTPGGSYRIPAVQFDWARGQESRRDRREIAARLLAKYGDRPAIDDEDMVAAMRRARDDTAR